MRSFRIRWPWMWTMCSGSVLALGIVTGHGDAAQAGPVPPAGIETWDQDHPAASSRPAPTPFVYPDEYSYEYGEHSYDQLDPEGKYGYSETLNGSVWDDDAAAEEDQIGQLGNAANFSHERDWENAPYEFGDGTTADVREVAAGSASNSQAEEAETSLAYEFGCEFEAEYSYGRSATDFAYPEEYFYKYGYQHYDYADSEGKYGSSEALDAEDDRIGQIGNAANFSHERDWENAPYEFGDGTTADVREVALAATPEVDAWDADVSAPYEYGYEMDAEYDDGYTSYPYGEEGDYAVEQSEELSPDHWIDDDSSYSSYGSDASDDELSAEMSEPLDDDAADQTDAGGVNEQSIGEAGMDGASYGYPTESESEYSYSDSPDYDYDDAYGYDDVDRYSSDYSDEGLADDQGSQSTDESYWDGYGYEYSYPQEKYGYAPQAAGAENEVESAKVDYEAEYDFDSRHEGEPGELIDYSQWKGPYAYDYAEPYDCFGENRSTVEPPTESGLELFAQHPNELLLTSDLELVRNLETLCEEPSGTRRSVLNDYLEGLGFVAIDFAARFEDVTGMETLSLADDLPGVAAFLGCFRLVEQGELGMDEAVDLLRRTLERPSLAWVDGVREIAANANEGRREHPAVEHSSQATVSVGTQGAMAKAVTSVLWAGWGQLQGTYSGMADRLAGWDWEAWIVGLQDRLAEARGVSQYEAF